MARNKDIMADILAPYLGVERTSDGWVTDRALKAGESHRRLTKDKVVVWLDYWQGRYRVMADRADGAVLGLELFEDLDCARQAFTKCADFFTEHGTDYPQAVLFSMTPWKD